MVRSCTGSFLTGPILRPDIISPSRIEVDATKQPRVELTMDGAKIVWLNRLGYIPGVSILTGAFRLLVGLVHTIVHLAKSAFGSVNQQKAHLDEAFLGSYNVTRGMIEMVPLLGNTLCFAYDIKRCRAAEAPGLQLMRGMAALAAGA